MNIFDCIFGRAEESRPVAQKKEKEKPVPIRKERERSLYDLDYRTHADRTDYMIHEMSTFTTPHASYIYIGAKWF